MNDAINSILLANDIDPNQIVNNGQTAFQYLEGHILQALDDIEEVT